MTATATATATADEPKRVSPFHPVLKVTLAIHDGASATAAPIAQADSIAKVLEAAFPGYACKSVSRSRAPKAGTAKKDGPASLMVYVAPAGHKYATSAERGVRLDSETAGLLRQIAATMGLDPSDSASIVAVAKLLAQKATPTAK